MKKEWLILILILNLVLTASLTTAGVGSNGTWINQSNFTQIFGDFSSDNKVAIDAGADNSNNYYLIGKDSSNTARIAQKFNKTAGYTALPNISDSTFDIEDLAIGPDNSLYVAGTLSSVNLFVKKFNGTNWINLSNSTIFADLVTGDPNPGGSKARITVDPQNNVYVTSHPFFQTFKYNGSEWSHIGKLSTSSASNGVVYAIDPMGAAIDLETNGTNLFFYTSPMTGGITIQKYNGSTWSIIGNSSIFSNTLYPKEDRLTGTDFPDDMMTVDNSGNLYITGANDSFATNKAQVLKYDGTTWNIIGDNSTFAETVDSISDIRVDRLGNIAIAAWRDKGAAIFTPTIQVYDADNSSWVKIAPPYNSFTNFTAVRDLAIVDDDLFYSGYIGITTQPTILVYNRSLLFCGDGAINVAGEECDDGNAVSGDGCSSLCKIESCGDGIIQAGLGETCDDGNTGSGDGCSTSCTEETLKIIPFYTTAGDFDTGISIANIGLGTNVSDVSGEVFFTIVRSGSTTNLSTTTYPTIGIGLNSTNGKIDSGNVFTVFVNELFTTLGTPENSTGYIVVAAAFPAQLTAFYTDFRSFHMSIPVNEIS